MNPTRKGGGGLRFDSRLGVVEPSSSGVAGFWCVALQVLIKQVLSIQIGSVQQFVIHE